jgi:hypothetical protein
MDHSSLDMTFLDMPNKMYPGTWVVVGLILTAILSGFIYVLVKYLKTRVQWKKLPLYPSASYFGKNHDPNTVLLVDCLQKSMELLSKHSRHGGPPNNGINWGFSAVQRALRDVRIYVMDTDAWVDEFDRKVAGIQAGRNLFVGKDLAAFLHECAHRCEEVIDKERDMEHTGWVGNGIRAAEDEFHLWLKLRS